MKQYQSLFILLSIFSHLSFAQHKTPPRPKIPHSHHSEKGGAVLMFGDDHLEVLQSEDGKNLFIFFSDKFRTPLQPSDFAWQVSLMEGLQKSKLSGLANTQSPFELKIPLAAKPNASAELEIKAPRHPRNKGSSVSTDRPQTIRLSRVPVVGSQNPARHQGH